eukprot:Gb_19967 [translate_table: standard]
MVDSLKIRRDSEPNSNSNIGKIDRLRVTITIRLLTSLNEDDPNKIVTIRPLTLGRPTSDKKANGEYRLALQEGSGKVGKVTDAEINFLHFQVYRLDPTVNVLAMVEVVALFKKLKGLQPCKVSEIKVGTHIFAVCGDKFFKNASYTIKAIRAKSFEESTGKLNDVEDRILAKQKNASVTITRLMFFPKYNLKATPPIINELRHFGRAATLRNINIQTGQSIPVFYNLSNTVLGDEILERP